jgi:hypothetical protein
MFSLDEAQAVVMGMVLGAAALAYLIILTMLRISINRRKVGGDKPSNS